MLRILHLSIGSVNDGATKAAYALNKELSNYSEVESLIITNELSTKFNYLLKKYNHYVTKNSNTNHTYSSSKGFYNISDLIINQNADILHFHHIPSTLDLKKVLSINLPIVWSIRDMWPFTGGCHYSFNCKGYKQNSCSICPIRISNHTTTKSFNTKMKVLGMSNVYTVGVSKWITDELSNLAINNKPININNTIPHIEHNVDIKRKYKSNGVAFIARYLDDYYKGFELALQAVDDYNKYHTPIKLHVIGESNRDFSSYNFVEHHHFTSLDEMIRIFEDCRFVINTSIMDNLPKSVLESMCLYNPIVAFNHYGLKELVKPGKSGFLSDPLCIEGLVDSIEAMMLMDYKKYSNMCNSSHKHYQDNYSMNKQVPKLINLYESISR